MLTKYYPIASLSRQLSNLLCNMIEINHRFDAGDKPIVQVCIKVVSCWSLGEMAWAIPAERVFDRWMVAETEVSVRLNVPTASRDREIRPTPDYTWWFRHEKFVGTSWGKIGSYWGSAWFAVNYLRIAVVAISKAAKSDARCPILSANEYCFGAVWRW